MAGVTCHPAVLPLVHLMQKESQPMLEGWSRGMVDCQWPCHANVFCWLTVEAGCGAWLLAHGGSRLDLKNFVSDFLFFVSFQSYWSICKGDAQFWALPNVTTHKNVTGAFIENWRHSFLDQPFEKWHRVVLTTFLKIRVYAISFRRLGNFSKMSSYPGNIYSVFPHFRLTFCHILLLLSFQKIIYTLMGFPFKIHTMPPQKRHVIYPRMIP